MSLLKRAFLVAAVAGLVVAVAVPADAHVTVNPNTATPGGYTKVTFRVPSETDNADTTKLEVAFPADQPIASVSVKPVPGWTATATESKLATPIKSHDHEITEAVSRIVWTADTGAAVKPGQFQEFDVSLGPLPASGQLIFKALQTYSDGTVVRWIDEPSSDGTEPEHPAPALKLAAAPAAATPAVPAAPEITPAPSGTRTFSVLGLLAGVLALLLAAAAFIRAGRHRAAPAAAQADSPSEPSIPAARS